MNRFSFSIPELTLQTPHSDQSAFISNPCFEDKTPNQDNFRV